MTWDAIEVIRAMPHKEKVLTLFDVVSVLMDRGEIHFDKGQNMLIWSKSGVRLDSFAKEMLGNQT